MRPLSITYEETEAIFRSVAEEDLRSVLVASTEAGEGASTIAYALAQRISATGKEVLYIDFNVCSSYPANELCIEPTAWTIDGAPEPASFFSIPGSSLSILAAPAAGFTNVGKLDPSRVKITLCNLLETFDCIVGDAPCLGRRAYSGLPTATLAAAFEAVILVLLSGATISNSAEAAVRQLRNADARILGVVMNDREMPHLRQELTRQAAKLDFLLPGLSQAVERTLRRFPVLSVDY